jgi:invasion protein IalB
MFKSTFGIELLLILVLYDGIADAATLTPPPPVLPSNPTQPAAQPQELSTLKTPGAGWISRCVGESRKGPLECSMEETLVLTNTGQLVTAVAVQSKPGTPQLVMTIRVPGGLYIPAGLTLQIDDGKAQVVPLQTCDQQGCYAETPISAELLAALKTGKRLSITCQNAAKNNFVLPLVLNNFADTLSKIQ